MASLDKTTDEIIGNYRRARATGKLQLPILRDQMAAGPVSANAVRYSLMGWIRDITALATEVSNDVINLEPIVRELINTPTFDLSAYITSVITEATALRDLIITSIPTSAGGFMEVETFETDGSITVRTFNSAATTSLRTAIDDLLAVL